MKEKDEFEEDEEEETAWNISIIDFFGCYSMVFRNEVSNCSLYSPFGLVERSL